MKERGWDGEDEGRKATERAREKGSTRGSSIVKYTHTLNNWSFSISPLSFFFSFFLSLSFSVLMVLSSLLLSL